MKGDLFKPIKDYWRNKGFRQFVKRTAIFVMVFIFMPIILYPFLEMSRYGRGEDPLPFFLVDVGAAMLFIVLAFFFLAKEKLKRIRMERWRWRESIIWMILTLGGLTLYLWLRYITSHNVEFTKMYEGWFATAIIASLVVSFTSLILVIYGFRFVLGFLKQFKKELGISIGMIILYYAITLNIRRSWTFLGNIVSNSVAWLLGLSFDSAILEYEGYNYRLGAEGFVARIGDLCSGIDSMSLFLGLFLLILALDWRSINKKKMAIIFIPGLLGTVLVNILRIYLLYISGIFISPNFAVGMFHSNAGWILFIIYFVIFWYLAYPWVKR